MRFILDFVLLSIEKYSGSNHIATVIFVEQFKK